jgi:long-chain acyl-CoA synthetase
MTTTWTLSGVLQVLADRGEHPAMILAGESELAVTASASLAADVVGLAHRLREFGLARGERVAVCGPSSPEWIVVALAVIAAGGVMVPFDDEWDPHQFDAALAASGVRLLFAACARLQAARTTIMRHGLRTLRLDGSADDPSGWRALPPAEPAPLPEPALNTPIILAWTSGTTGMPKIFPLTLENIATNIEALVTQHIADGSDRALLPLPLYHVYPFIVGVLTTLTIGTTVVLPTGTSGPLIIKALRSSEATVVIGVPRLYEAIINLIDVRMMERGALLRLLWRGLIAASARLDRTGLHVGRMLFAPIRRSIAPRLRLLVAGGARMEATVEERLTALGWLVLSGYGLAETASIFTANLPGDRRAGSAGKPLGDGAVRIAEPDPAGVGEVQLHGPAVTSGYLNNPAANAASFTADGWFRTGDVGYVDPDGFLFITGRANEILVLGGGKKISPEDLEKHYTAPGIAELAVLEVGGALVALVRPDVEALRARRVTNLRDGVDVALTQQAQDLPSYEHLAGFALTEIPLPRTQLGKLRRFMLPPIYTAVLAGVVKREARPLSDDDLALLRDPVANGIWEMVQYRYPEKAIDLDVNVALELNLDSFGWMELAVSLDEQFGIALTETDIAAVTTIRDLLGVAGARRQSPAAAASAGPDLDRWLAPTGPLTTLVGLFLAEINRLLMRAAFRLRASGLHRLPEHGGFILTPNHVSDLDPLVIAAALPLSQLRRIHWAGDTVRLFSSRLSRGFCRAVHVFPVDETHPAAALRGSEHVLRAGDTLVWFPEGWRSPDGRCRRFMPGIGQLLLRIGTPAVPVWIDGAFEALPRSRRVPRLRPIAVIFGEPVSAETLREKGQGLTDEERIAEALRRRVIALAPR